jgi:hypothetical protein
VDDLTCAAVCEQGPLSENDLKERLKRLQRAVEESSCCVAKGVAGLELQADVTELQARLDRALEEGFHDDEEEEEDEEAEVGVRLVGRMAAGVETRG